MSVIVRRSAALAVWLALVACARDRASRAADTLAASAEGVAVGAAASSDAHFVANIIGLDGPESARYDAEQDAWLISNMRGAGSAKDDNGYVTRVAASPPYAASILVQGGAGGAVLHAPKGMTIHGDTLWIADIDALRGFDRHTGAPLATIDFAPLGAVLLNDVALGPDGTLRVTDTGIIMSPKGVLHPGPDRIFTVGPGGAVSIAADSTALRMPNGITWDLSRRRWVVVSFDPFAGEVATLGDGGRPDVLFRTPRGRFDGVEALADGTILYASWSDSSLHALRDGTDRRIVREVPEPADIGYDTRRGIVAIPLSTLGRVQLWKLDAR